MRGSLAEAPTRMAIVQETRERKLDGRELLIMKESDIMGVLPSKLLPPLLRSN